MDIENDSVLIVGEGLKKGWLEKRNADPTCRFSIYSLSEAEKLFSYAYDYRALRFLLEQGKDFGYAERALKAISHTYGIEDISPLGELGALRDALLKKNFIYATPYPERLFKGKKVYVQGIEETSLRYLKKRLPDVVFTSLPEVKGTGTAPFYRFVDSYQEAHYILNSIARLIDMGTKPGDIYVYGAEGELRTYLEKGAYLYGFEFGGRSLPMASVSEFKRFLNLVKEGVPDKQAFAEGFPVRNEKNDFKELEKAILAFSDLPIVRKIALYEEFSHVSEFTLISYFEGPSFAKSPHFPSGSKVFVAGATLGSLPPLYKEDPLIGNEGSRYLGLLSSDEKELVAAYEAKKLLHDPSVLFFSYSVTSDGKKNEPSYLFMEEGRKEEEAPMLPYEYGEDEGLLPGAFLLEKEEKGTSDPRIPSYRKSKELRGTFPRPFKPFAYEAEPGRVHSYSSVQKYTECPFKYYCAKILEVDDFEDTFYTRLGTYVHAAVEYRLKGYANGKAMEEAYAAAERKSGEFSAAEKVLLKKIDALLPDFLDVTVAREAGLEGEVNVEAEKKILLPVNRNGYGFVAYLDRYIEYGKKERRAMVVDFKTGSLSSNAFDSKLFYGHKLKMQLPLYAYALRKSRVLGDSKLSALYIAPANFAATPKPFDPEILKDPEYLDTIEKSWKLKGVFDSSPEAMEDLGALRKNYYVIPREPEPVSFDDLADTAERYLEEIDQGIREGDFGIRPFVIAKNFNSCDNCSFRDICYRKPEDVSYRLLSGGIDTRREESEEEDEGD